MVVMVITDIRSHTAVFVFPFVSVTFIVGMYTPWLLYVCIALYVLFVVCSVDLTPR